MAMSVVDTLPLDAGAQKFLAPVDPDTGNFALLRGANVETVDSLDYADLAVALHQAVGTMVQTHNAVSVGTAESVGTEVTSGGYSRGTAFVSVGSGADVRVTLYCRLTTGGDNYEIAILNDGQQASTRKAYVFEFAAPFLVIALQVLSESATCSCSVYLIP